MSGNSPSRTPAMDVMVTVSIKGEVTNSLVVDLNNSKDCNEFLARLERFLRQQGGGTVVMSTEAQGS